MPEAPTLTIVLATNNTGKLRELAALFAELPVELRSVGEVLGRRLDVEEDGETFEENAILKARAVCRETGMVALADDSGLEVLALGGRPGVRSARFASEHATDTENNAALLAALDGVTDRAATFRAVLALVTPWSNTPHLAEGRLNGSITLAPRGSRGFGYDPLFLLDPAEEALLGTLTESALGAGTESAALGAGTESAALGAGTESAVLGAGTESAVLGAGTESAALGAGTESAAPGARTLAELSEAEKNRVSHRARAALALRPRLQELLHEYLDQTERILG